MSSSAITTPTFQAKAGSIQNQADSSSIYSAGVWSFKNSTALTSVTISDAGRVGIGTASPSSKLHVIDGDNTFITNDANTYPRITTNNSDAQLGLFRSGTNAGGGYIGGSGTAAFLVLSSSFQERMRIDASGNVGIGLAPTEKLHVNNGIVEVHRSPGTGNAAYFRLHHAGSVYVNHNISSNTSYDIVNNSNGVRLAVNGSSWGAISDERKKKNIKPLEYGLAQVAALKPVRFDYKTEESDDSVRIGFIAQELLPVIKEAVQGSEDTEYSVTPTDLIPVLVKAIQELSAKNEALEARLAALESK